MYWYGKNIKEMQIKTIDLNQEYAYILTKCGDIVVLKMKYLLNNKSDMVLK